MATISHNLHKTQQSKKACKMFNTQVLIYTMHYIYTIIQIVTKLADNIIKPVIITQY